MQNQPWLMGIKEIIGLDNLDDALNLAGIEPIDESEPVPLSKVGIIEQVLGKTYGIRGSQGVMQRCGRACFKYFLIQHGQELGLNSLSFRLQPSQKRMQMGLIKLAEYFSSGHDLTIEQTVDERSWNWRIQNFDNKTITQANTNIAHFLKGFLQDYLAWVGNGKHYIIAQIKSSTSGTDEFMIRIDKKSVE